MDFTVQFELIIVIEHIGHIADVGHYVFFRKHNKDWFRNNDTVISKCEYFELETANLFIYGNSDEKKWAYIIIDR